MTKSKMIKKIIHFLYYNADKFPVSQDDENFIASVRWLYEEYAKAKKEENEDEEVLI